jgi:hypothetical protein
VWREKERGKFNKIKQLWLDGEDMANGHGMECLINIVVILARLVEGGGIF